MKKVGAIDYILANGSVVTVKMESTDIFEYFEGGAFALLNTELTDCGADDSKQVSVSECRAAVTHAIIRLGSDSSLIENEDGTLGANIKLGGGDLDE